MSLDLVVQLFSIVGGGGLVSWAWTWQRDRLEQYRNLDASYCQLLAEYRKTPDFGDPAKTSRYEHEFGSSLDYHFFAMTVHNTLETLFDTLDGRPEDHDVWSNVFKYHAVLHSAWLEKNDGAFEREYVASVRRAVANTVPASAEKNLRSVRAA